ncbi:hypothetical protein LJC58_02585 [Lachnospiraceae bacterium OttesenSCG-928-D06]|nr:hypothetical protein [Lachnospiraceae bacterium OttesenSCG-928-D06]
MKKIIISLMMVSILSSCASGQSQTVLQDENNLEPLLLSYEDFLYGRIDAKSDDNSININEIFWFDDKERAKYNQYALFDMNGDGLPEFHVRSVDVYDIFTYQDGNVTLWHSDVSYSYPLNNGAILYTRNSGAPTHIDYAYTFFDFYGKEIYKIYFSVYDSTNESNYNENALFIFDEVELSKENWDSLTERYFSVGSDLIKWTVYED